MVCIYCLGRAGVSGNERADSLAPRAPISGILRMDRVGKMQEITGNLVRGKSVVQEIKDAEVGNHVWCESRITQKGTQCVANQCVAETIRIHILQHLLGENERLWVCHMCHNISS